MQRNKLPGLISGMVTCDKEINDMKDKYDVAVCGMEIIMEVLLLIMH